MSDIGLSEARIAVLVDRFYDKVRVDPLLGPVFNAAVDDWDEHKRLLTAFWCTVALHARSYRGNPLAKHRPLPIEVAHFERWLSLWMETTHEVLDEAGAEVLTGYAGRIAIGLSTGIGLDEMPRASIRASL
jgi:hemoglobin